MQRMFTITCETESVAETKIEETIAELFKDGANISATAFDLSEEMYCGTLVEETIEEEIEVEETK